MSKFVSSLNRRLLRKVCSLLFLCSALSLALLATLSSAIVQASSVVDLLPGEDAKHFAQHVWQTNQLDDQASIEDAIRLADAFTRNNKKMINLGLSKSAIWLRFDVHNRGEVEAHWRISFNRVLLEAGDIYKVQNNVPTRIYSVSNTAERLDSYREYRTLSARLALKANEHATIYVRYLAPNWSGLSISLQTDESLKNRASQNLTLYMLCLFSVALIVLFTISQAPPDLRTTSYFVASQLVYFFYFSHITGFTTLYLWPNNPELWEGLPGILSAMHSLFIVLFARRFFETKTAHRNFDAAIRGLTFLLLAYLTLSLVFPTDAGRRGLNPFGQLTTFLTWAVMPCLAIQAVRNGNRTYWPLAVGWLVLAGTLMLVVLMYAGVVNSFYLGTYSYGALACFEALCMSLAQALRSRSLAQKIQTSERSLSFSLERQFAAAQSAEQASSERTMALQDLSDLGNSLVSSSHDAQQLVFALKNVVRGLQDRTADKETITATHIISQITDSLGDLLVTQTKSSYGGGINNQTMAIEMITASATLEAQRLIHQTSANVANIQLIIHCQEDHFVSDRVMIQRMLSNMVSNAIKHSGATKILMNSRRRRQGVCFQIWDNGRGIDEEHLDSLLNSAKNKERVDDGRLGEGLRNCQRLASCLGGQFSARSRPDRGSVFEFLIPTPALAETASFPAVTLIGDDPSISKIVEAKAQSLRLLYHCVPCERITGSSTSSPTIPSGLVIIDHKFISKPISELTDYLSRRDKTYTVVVATSDRSIETRMNLSLTAEMILYKPLNRSMLEFLHQRL